MEMLSAQEALVKEANDILEKAKDGSEKARKLKEAGFIKAKGVEVLAMAEEAAAQKQMFERYSVEYPGLKFIPDKAMDDVCRKYGLVIGEVSRYKGEVPSWALDVIHGNKHLLKKHLRRIPSGERMDGMRVAFGWPTKRYGVISDSIPNYSYSRVRTDSGKEVTVGTYRRMYEVTGGELLISAPISQMELREREYISGNRIMVEPKDPIVSIKVEGGYIVLAAWGEEGQDTRVFNVNNN